MRTVNANTTPAEPWGERCLAWRLLAGTDLAVAEELMPPRTTESRHVHERARQFFYVLEGELAMEHDGDMTTLRAGDGLEVPPGTPHRAHNSGDAPVRFLVVSAPSTKGDRRDLG